ncbi:toprim domain-containing protein, partial [Jatrophihabitans sp.]|uniref:DNA primase n=1 Tax=Jatrophihabitans sp. TaxID=1932789 RepID=UPI002B52EF42|nr:toprim domain-containing protein [Jatrophihabitans sp.]
TDVMACHLAGVTTAVATCGTAFGGEHVNVIRRLWSTNSAEEAQATTKVIFTFDGDAAGMKAAERAFKDEQKFLAQTFVAIDPSGKDPCDLRQAGGDQAVRALIESNVPMLRFMLGTIIKRFDVDTVEGRVAALNLTVPLVAQIKDPSHRFEYARELARLSGVANPDEILSRVRGMARAADGQHRAAPSAPAQPLVPGVPPKVGQAEREVIKAALQLPEVVAEQFDQLGPQAFLTAVYQQLQSAIAAAGGAAAGRTGPAWVERVAEHLPPESEARAAVNALAVEPLRSGTDTQSRYAEAMVMNLAEQVVGREVAQLKSRVQRLDAVSDAEEQGRLFGQLMQLEQRRRALRVKAIGGEA